MRANGIATSAAGITANLALRLCILHFLIEVLRNPNDPRFAGKAIPIRNTIIVVTLTSLFPVLRWVGRRYRRYPVWLDNVSLDLLAGHGRQLVRPVRPLLPPRSHPLLPQLGALAVVLRGLGMSPLGAFDVANTIHVGLEAQEYYTDVLFGTHNVRGVSDTVNEKRVA
jgi:hypothetical protein